MSNKFLLFILLTVSSLSAQPGWFSSRNYASNNQTFYGYGEGKNEHKARANALNEITEQISSNVSSTISLHTRVSGQKIFQNMDSSTFVSSSQTLKNTKVIRLEQKDGTYYILMKYIYTTPFWYESRNFESPLFSLIGYGSGLSMKDAINDARVDISSQISANITSSTTIINSQKNEQSSINIDDSVSSSTQSLIKESKVIKSEKIAENYFVAVSYKKFLNSNVPKIVIHFLTM